MRSIGVRSVLVLGLLFQSWCGLGDPLTVPAAQPAVGARMPALSPDGRRLAFVYQGDVWIVNSAGGRALPLTWHLEMDAFPVFSPDGQWLAFGSKRSGNWDIFLVPAEGGSVRQLTYHSADEIPQGWSPDGSKILFARKGDGLGWSLFELDVRTLHPTELLEDYSSINFPNYSSDGKWIVYGRNGFHWSRPRYQGSAAAQIWLWNTETYQRQALTDDQRQHLWTHFLPDNDQLLTVTVGEPTPFVSKMGESIPKFIDTPERTPNLWLFDRHGHSRQKTFFVGGSVRCPTVAMQTFVLAINGREVRLDENLFRWINDKQDREFEFLVNAQPNRDGARLVRYRVMTQEDWRDLVYKNRVERLREQVERKSSGKIGYLHLPSMGQSNQAQFEREAFEYVVGKEAMIIDVRFNNGGYIADTLIDWLERKPRGYLRPRDGAIQPSPARAWDKPIVVLMNEHSFSNGEIFAYAMRARGLARLVGMPTPGYVIWTDSLTLVDGTGARIPMSAFYRLDATPQENSGEPADFKVALSPEDWVQERDPQLDKAVALLQSSSNPVSPAHAPTVVSAGSSDQIHSSP